MRVYKHLISKFSLMFLCLILIGMPDTAKAGRYRTKGWVYAPLLLLGGEGGAWLPFSLWGSVDQAGIGFGPPGIGIGASVWEGIIGSVIQIGRGDVNADYVSVVAPIYLYMIPYASIDEVDNDRFISKATIISAFFGLSPLGGFHYNDRYESEFNYYYRAGINVRRIFPAASIGLETGFICFKTKDFGSFNSPYFGITLSLVVRWRGLGVKRNMKIE